MVHVSHHVSTIVSRHQVSTPSSCQVAEMVMRCVPLSERASSSIIFFVAVFFVSAGMYAALINEFKWKECFWTGVLMASILTANSFFYWWIGCVH